MGQMKNLDVGDNLWLLVDGKPLPVAHKITDVSVVVDHGLHSPVLINGGLPLVNGFVTSFDESATVKTATNWLPTMIDLCKATGTCSVAKRFFAFSENKHIA